MRTPTVVFTEPRRAEIQDVEIPALKPNEMLVESEVTLVSIGTEMTVYCKDEGLGQWWTKGCRYPFYPGYSNVGVVREVGQDGDKGLVGARVESYGRHARFAVQPLDKARPVRADVASDHAVFATMAEIAFQGVRRAGTGMGSSVVIYGLGLLGQLSARFARLCGARPVLCVDLGDMRLGLLPKHPALIPVNPAKTDVREAVREATRGRMADIVIELTGVPGLIPDEIRLLRKEGTLAIVSSPRGKTEIDFHDLCNSPSVRIVGIHNSSHTAQPNAADPWTKNRDVELFLDLVGDGDMDVAPMISHKRPYTDAPEMYRMLLEDRTQAMGVLFDWTVQQS